jgi:hypothetical protein
VAEYVNQARARQESIFNIKIHPQVFMSKAMGMVRERKVTQKDGAWKSCWRCLFSLCPFAKKSLYLVTHPQNVIITQEGR